MSESDKSDSDYESCYESCCKSDSEGDSECLGQFITHDDSDDESDSEYETDDEIQYPAGFLAKLQLMMSDIVGSPLSPEGQAKLDELMALIKK